MSDGQFKIEMRVITLDGQSVSGVSSRPISRMELCSPEIFNIITNYAYALIGNARNESHTSLPEKGDRHASVSLRQFADQIDSGKYVLSVHSKDAGDGKREIILLLDPNKS